MDKILNKSVRLLRGVGPKREKALELLSIRTVRDVLWFFPRDYRDRRFIKNISSLSVGTSSVVTARVISVEKRKMRDRALFIFTAKLNDGTGDLFAVWFDARRIENTLQVGINVAVYGVPVLRENRLEMSSPEFKILKDDSDIESFCKIVPVYSLTAELSTAWMLKFVNAVVNEYVLCINQVLPDSVIRKRALMPRRDAVLAMHNPKSFDELKAAKDSLAYEELFLFQIAQARARFEIKKRTCAPAIRPDGHVHKNFFSHLEFQLTESQKRVWLEMFRDTASSVPMFRLLHGDVGSGKTLVAAGLICAACDSGVQTAIMAPTEVLANQLYSYILRFLSPCGVRVTLLTGSLSSAEKQSALLSVREGTSLVTVGTQALIEKNVIFNNLGLVIIDEQHRFGVRQRALLLEKHPMAHTLVMSATPIPRTLAQTMFSHLDVSVLNEKPQNRKKIETRLVDIRRKKEVLLFIAKEVYNGGKIYWVCPRVKNDEKYEISSVESRYSFLCKYMGHIGVGFLHGAMTAEESAKNISDFKCGNSSILVATTVVEVGVDVPDASVIVIESPEYFGLSQLHQLRGRVGRGERRGVCLLLTSNTSEAVSKRLSVMLETDDGFKIAQEDLAFRGFGEILGLKQHGAVEFKIADVLNDIDLMEWAKQDAFECAENTAELTELYAVLDVVHGKSSVFRG